MATLQSLREKRANLWSQMTDIMERALSGNRDLTAEERQTYDRLETDLDQAGDQIERQERHEERARLFESVDRSGLPPAVETPAPGDQDEQYARAFGAYLRNSVSDLSIEDRGALQRGFVDQRALGVGTSTAGGYTVPPGFRETLIQTMKTYGGMLQVSEVIHTNTGANLQWPTNDDTGNVGAILAENTQMAQQDVTLGTNSIDAYMYTSKLVLVSFQLLQDSAFNLESWLQTRLAERVGRILNAHFTTGTGTSQPDGIVTNVTVGKVCATGQTSTVLYTDLVDLIDSLDPAYQGNAQFMLSQSSRKAIRKLTDNQGHPLWQPSLLAGVPDQLLGYGYTVNQDLPTPAANSKSILFGDFAQAYLIRLVTDFAIIRFSERFADYLQTGFAGYQRADGTLQNPAACRALQQSAT